MNNLVKANDLKVRGITALDACFEKHSEAVINVRGQNKYVVMSIDAYEKLRECELEVAIMEAQKDVESRNVAVESVEKHIERLKG